MALKHVWIFPVLMSILIPVTLIITYNVSVYNKHVDPVFPYISDTGTLPPESCIFGQFLNVAALLGGITAYIRHRQIVEFYGKSRRMYPCILNSSVIFLWFGYLTCFGLSIVANFQETSLRTVHFIGASMAFVFGVLYGYGQTMLTYKIDRIFVGIWMAHCRLLISILGTACLVLLYIGYDPHIIRSYISDLDNSTVYKIEHGHNLTATEHDWYLVSAVSEWGIALCCVLFFCTFAAEFRKAILPPPKMLLTFRPDDIIYYRNSNQNESTTESRRNTFETDTSQFRPLLQTTSNHFPHKKKRMSLSSDEIYKRCKYIYGTMDE